MNLKELLQKIDELKAELDILRPISDENMMRFNQKIRLDWNYHSNSIEGNTLSYSETKSFLLHGITAKGKPFRDYLEMKGHNEALKILEDIANKEVKITENRIKEFHKLILVEPYIDETAEINPGVYKENHNYLYTNTGERIDFEPPAEVPRLMNELINWLNNHIEVPQRQKKKYHLHPLLIAAGFHAQFIKIHPFGDGNGRIARIIMNLILMMTGYVPAIIKLDDRDLYYSALNSSSIDEAEELAFFIGKEVINSLNILIKAAKGESVEEPDDLDKKLMLLQKEIESEDEDNIIKTKLSVKAIKDTFDSWGYKLLEKLAQTTIKFNTFYHSYKHDVTGFLENIQPSFPWFYFDNTFSTDKIKEYLENVDLSQSPHKADFRLHCYFDGFKKGGLKTFGCNYTFDVKFETYKYEVFVGYFDTNSNGEATKKYAERLLHKPITEEEIDDINKMWGDTLYNHLVENKKMLDSNSIT